MVNLNLTLRAYKGHLTRSAKELEKIATFVEINPSPRGLSELETSFKKYTTSLEKVESTIEEIIISEELEEQRINEYNTEIQGYYSKLDELRQKLLTINKNITLATKPAQPFPTTATPVKPRICDALKPFQLNDKHTPADLRNWIGKFNVYHSSSSMERYSTVEQHMFLFSCLNFSLETKVRENDSYNPELHIFGDYGVVQILQEEFDLCFPLFNRRLDFFRYRQTPGQKFTDFMIHLKQKGEEADLHSLDIDSLYVFRYITGITDSNLRERFLKLTNPNLDQLKKETRAYEIGKHAAKAMDDLDVTTVSKICDRKGTRYTKPFGFHSNKAPFQSKFPIEMKGRCWTCGSKQHDTTNCPKDKNSLTCFHCNKKGHLSTICISKFKSKSSSGDVAVALSEFRLMPRADGFSPANLMFNRSPRGLLPSMRNSAAVDHIAGRKARQKTLDASHSYQSSRPTLPCLKVGDAVLLQDMKTEMHRTQTEFDDNLIFKVFLFQFVNFYSSIFYIAFFKGKFVGYPGHYSHILGLRNEDCGNGGCLMELAQQLAVIMIGKQIINNIQEVVVPKLKTWWHQKNVKITENKNRWEEDYSLIENEGLFQEYLEMVLQFGFITIFVAAFPLAPLFALLNNWVEIRLDAQKIVCETRRIVPERAQDIGVWFRILETLAHLAVISNAFLIAFTSDFLPKLLYQYEFKSNLQGYVNFTLAYAPNGSMTEECRYRGYRNAEGHTTVFYWRLLVIRLGFVIVFEHVVFFVCKMIDWLVPDVPESLEIKIKRERYLAKQALADSDNLVLYANVKEDDDDPDHV
ncbi:Anoctamin-7 [Nymphon striatum]|nr:Anoctamin-7 [Nymphon striatum]